MENKKNNPEYKCVKNQLNKKYKYSRKVQVRKPDYITKSTISLRLI